MRGCAYALVVTAMACTESSPVPACTECGGACVDTLSDSSNCGACTAACDGGTRCEAGVCAATCAGLECQGACVDPQSDPMNCSACGYVCAAQNATAICVAGQCSHAPCDQGFYDCDFDESNGCESVSADCVTNVCTPDDAGMSRLCTLLGISSDGRRILFGSAAQFDPEDEFGTTDLFVFEPRTSAIRRLILPASSQVSGRSLLNGGISGDGNTVVFLYPGAGQPLQLMRLDTNEATPVPNDGALFLEFSSAPIQLSYDGSALAVAAPCPDGGLPNYIKCAVRLDTQTGAAFTTPFDDPMEQVAISPDGRLLGFIDGGIPYLANTETRAISQAIGRSRGGFEGGVTDSSLLAMSFDGTVVALDSDFRLIWAGAAGKPVTEPADGGLLGWNPTLSYDGRLISFTADEDTGCEVHDLDSGVAIPIPDLSPSACFGMLSGDGRTLATTDSNQMQGTIRVVHVNRP